MSLNLDCVENFKGNHSKQRGFMELYDTEEGQQLKNMNMRDEISFLTDNDQNENHITKQNQKCSDINNNQNETQNPKIKDEQNVFQYFQGAEERSILSSKVIMTHQNIVKQNLNKDIIDTDHSHDNLKQSSQKKIHRHESSKFQDEKTTKKQIEPNQAQQNYLRKNQSLRLQIPQDESVCQKKQYEKIRIRMNNFFRNNTYSGRRFYLEKRSVHQTLNDKSDGYFANKSQLFLINAIKIMIKEIKKFVAHSFLNRISVLSSQSKISLTIEILITIFNTFFFLILSILIVFDNVLVGEEVYIYKSALCVWAFDIFVRLNTSTYSNSNVVTDRKTILAIYIKAKLLWDIFPSILLFYLMVYKNNTVFIYETLSTKGAIQILCFTKLINISSDLDELQKKLCMMMKRYYLMKLANLIIKLFIIGHVIACTWYIIAIIETKYLGEEVTWYNESIASDLTWWKVYLLSMYWALTLMTTGSNVATTVLQTFFTSFIMLFTTIISGYMLNATGLILCEIDASEENKRNDLNIINDYMREKNISMNLQGRVNVYLEYYYQKNYQKQAEDIKNVFSKISTDLKSLMQKEYFYQILTKIDFLQRNFTQITLQNLSVQCEEVICFPNQIIFEQNDFRDAALLVIIEGQVEIYQQVGYNTNEQKTICYLNSGQILGQINFFTGMARSACAKAKGFAKLAKISQDNFLQVIKQNQQDLQIYYQMKDNILLYEYYEQMNIKCSACQSFKHLQGSCNLVHLNKEIVKDKIRLKNILKQERKNHDRFKGQKLNTFLHKNEVEKSFNQFIRNEDNIHALKLIYGDDFEDEDQLYSEANESDSQCGNVNKSCNTNSFISEQQIQLNKSLDQEDQQLQQQLQARSRKNSDSSFNMNKKSMPSIGNIQNQSINNNDSLIHPPENQKRNNKQSIKNGSVHSSNQNIFDISNAEMSHQVHIIDPKNKKSSTIQHQYETARHSKVREGSVTFKRDNESKFSLSTNYQQLQLELLQQSIQQYDIDNDNDEDKNMMNRQKQNSEHSSSLNINQDQRKSHYQTKKIRYASKVNESQIIRLKTNQKEQSSDSLNSIRKEQEDNKDINQEKKELFLWQFDRQKDYEFYFNHGNIRIRLQQFKIYQQSQLIKPILSKSLHVRKKQRKNQQNQTYIEAHSGSPKKTKHLV